MRQPVYWKLRILYYKLQIKPLQPAQLVVLFELNRKQDKHVSCKLRLPMFRKSQPELRFSSFSVCIKFLSP
jgi:hypothetical protein